MVHIVEKTRSAAPARNYSVMKRGNLMKHVALYFSESVFTFFSENLPYRSVLPLFDDMVEVNKFEACSLGEGLSESGFAASHISDYKQWFHKNDCLGLTYGVILDVFYKRS